MPQRRTLTISTADRKVLVSGHLHPKHTLRFDVHRQSGQYVVVKVPGYSRWSREHRASMHEPAVYEVYRILAMKKHDHATPPDPEHPILVAAAELLVSFPVDKRGTFGWGTTELVGPAEFEAIMRGQ